MGTVRNLKPAPGLSEFLSFLYGEEEAYVHLPIKDPDTDKYEYDFFFRWPIQRKEIVNHVERYSKSAEVFITPGMFKSCSSSVAEAHGSYVAWADFDGNVPSLEELEEAKIPMPTLRVQSSIPGHEHWYWRYDQFNTDVTSIQGINKALAYALEADIGAWDAGHSTRPVGSFNHKRAANVSIKDHNSNSYRIADFSEVPPVTNSYDMEQFRKEQIPNILKVIGRHQWSDDTLDLLSKGVMTEGVRSSALARLAYGCAESGLDNSEMFAVIQFKDKHWKKFVGRENKEKYYVDLINYARQKYPYEGIKDVTVLAEELETYDFEEVLNYVDETEWIIEGFLPRKAVAYVVGRSGSGKSTLCLGMCASLALGRQYLWEHNPTKYKVLYLSLEMNMEDLNQFYRSLANNYSPAEIKELKKHFHSYANPEKVKFYKPTSLIMGKLLRKLENFKPDVMLVDSAAYSLAANLNNQDEITASIEVIDMIKEKYGVTVLFVHHTRKDPPSHGYREAELDDVFGSTYIAGSAASIISLKKAETYTEQHRLMDIRYLKTRFSGDNTGFSVVQDSNRMFKKPTMGELTAAPTPVAKKKKPTDDKSYFDI